MRSSFPLAALAALSLLIGGCPQGGGEDSAAEQQAKGPAVPVTLATVRAGDIQTSARATSVFLGWRDVTLAAEVGGTVLRIPHDEGSKVAQGELLLELDHTQLDAQLASTQAQLDAARAQLTEIRDATRPQQLAQAEAALSQASAALDLAQKTYIQVQELYDAGVVARSQLDAAEAGLAQAQAAYDAAAQQVSLAREGARAEQIEMVEAQVRGLEAALVMVQDQRDSAFVTAPFGGKLAVVYPEEHEMVGPGAPLLSLVDDSVLELTVGVDDTAVAVLELGHVVQITVDALGLSVQGHISSIGVKADEASGLFPVKLTVPNEDGKVLAGMVGTVALPLETRRDVIVLPREVILFQRGEAMVMVRDGEHARSLKVELGLESETHVEIVSGLSAGDELICVGQQNVFDGDLIEITNTCELPLPQIVEQE